jgi:4-diphosphocytidyl-2C-methyl-D-erythritol kinase
VVPPVHCDTADVYRRFDETGGGDGAFDERGRNALLRPALGVHPGLAPYSDAVRMIDASYAGMSGSGSAFFAAFATAGARDTAREQLACGLPEARIFECSATEAGYRVVEGDLG